MLCLARGVTCVAILAILLFLAFGEYAKAAEFKRYKKAIVLLGHIERRDVLKMTKAAKLKPTPRAIILDSVGGNVKAAMEIAYLVRKNKLMTMVANNNMCSSACVLILVAGEVKYVGINSRIGLHSAALMSGSFSYWGTEAVNDMMYNHLVKNGMPHFLANKVHTIKHSSTYYLSRRDKVISHMVVIK